jgi:hypothetical protein
MPKNRKSCKWPVQIEYISCAICMIFYSWAWFASMGPILVVQFQIRIVLYIFYAFLDKLPMIEFSSIDSILIKVIK